MEIAELRKFFKFEIKKIHAKKEFTELRKYYQPKNSENLRKLTKIESKTI